MTRSTRTRRAAGAMLAAAILSGSPAHAGVLLGTAGLEKDADLTRVATATRTLEFLDLTTTQGWSVDAALFGFGPQGFRLARGDDMRELMSAFGITYVVTGDYLAELISTEKYSAAFADYLGATWSDAAFGISYEGARGMLIYSCISTAGCGQPPNYVAMEDLNFGDERMGVYLVREAPLPVPLPATLPLAGIGMLAMAGALARWRKPPA